MKSALSIDESPLAYSDATQETGIEAWSSAYTLLAILFTPLLTWLYVGQKKSVPVERMRWSIFKIVLLPVSLGVALAEKCISGADELSGALFSIWHNLSGSMLAGYWSRRER